VEVKLVDIGEMEYFSTDKPYPRGEVCLRGPSCFTGYWKDPIKTAETIDSEGWIHTGDVGLFDARGRLRIIDRKKNIFKLAQGEYVAPERVENILSKHPLLAQVFIWGESIKSCLVAVVVPEAEAVKRIIPNVPFAEACQDAKVLEAVMAAIAEYGGKGTKELKGFEMPRRVHLESEPFSIQNGLLTDTMKMKRHEAKKRYLQVIQQLYSTLNE
jgi:long-chain acyl-CoA synthetase